MTIRDQARATRNDSKSLRITDIISENKTSLLANWIKEQIALASKQQGKIKEPELRQQCGDFLDLIYEALRSGNANINSETWEPVLDFLTDISRTRSEKDFTPSETATFVFSLKRPLFVELREALGETSPQLAGAIWDVTEILDKLELYTPEIYKKNPEEVIARQQQDMLELSTPVVSLAEGILALPLIGTLDSSRTQVVMESLLQTIVQTGSTVAIIDITGVPTVDTLVAQHLLKTVTAARLMGADCIISGIRPQIAQTIVHLGVELGNVTTKASLAAAFRNALDRRGLAIVRVSSAGAKVLEKQ